MKPSSVFFLLIFSIIILLNGCASLSKEECQQGNWKHIGFRDGSRGLSKQRYDRHVEACSKYKITPDYNNYVAGWSEGLEQVYCRPRNAYTVGLSGAAYNNICPAHLEQEFITAYQYGKDIWHTENELAAARTAMQEIEKQLLATGREIDELNEILHVMRDRRFSLKNRIGTHIVDELENIDSFINSRIPAVNHQLQLNQQEIRDIQKLLDLYNRKGKQQARLDWLQSGGINNPQIQKKIEHTRVKIAHLDREIKQLTASGVLSRRTQHQAAPVIMLLSQSDYSGQLNAQLAILDKIERRTDLSAFIHFHYRNEPENIRIKSKKRFAHPAYMKSIRQLRKEIRLLERDYTSLLNDKHRTAAIISDLENQVSEMRRLSPYR